MEKCYWTPDTEGYLSQHHDDHDQSKKVLCNFERKTEHNYDVEFTAISGWFKQFKNCYSLHNVKVSSEFVSTDAKAAEELLKILDKLCIKITWQSKYSI